MADEKVPTQEELQKQLEQALASKDWKQISKVAGEIKKIEDAKEAAKKEALLKKLEEVTNEVKVAIQGALKAIVDSKKLDAADGVWFAWDFGEKMVSCRVTKTAPRKGGGGGGKKYDISTTDMLEKYGNREYKDGQTFKAAYEGDADKNKRFAIRTALLKLAKEDGMIK